MHQSMNLEKTTIFPSEAVITQLSSYSNLAVSFYLITIFHTLNIKIRGFP